MPSARLLAVPVVLLALSAAAVAWSADYPSSSALPLRAADGDMAAERERLFALLKNARTETEARTIEDGIWRLWMAQGPTIAVRHAVAAAMDARESYEFVRALELLDGVVDDAPDYAEGWNQRAFILFLMDRPDESLEDIDRALALEPKHFGALAGKGIILMQQGRVELGQKALRDAVAIDPWLKERGMIIPDPEHPLPQPGGKDI